MHRYWVRGELADLDRSLALWRQALATTPTDAPDRATYLSSLGGGLRDRYERRGLLADLEAAQSSYRSACEWGLETALEPALVGAHTWGNWALKHHAWEEAVEAYDYSAKAIERLLEAQLLRSAKESWLCKVQGLAANAAYTWARVGDLERAVEVVEGGRARLLAEALERHRHDLEQLPARDQGELLARYRQAAARWATLTAETARTSEAALPDGATRRGALAAARAELDAVVQAVRQVPGYADFLGAPTFMRIHDAAWEAPLVYLMATPAGVWRSSCRGWPRTPPSQVPLRAGRAARRAHRRRGAQAALGDLRTPRPWAATGGLRPLARRATRISAPTGSIPGDDDPLALGCADGTANSSSCARGGSESAPVPDIVLLPTGLLGLLPLQAAWTEDAATPHARRYIMDSVALRYAPNARALSAAQALAETPLSERLLLCVEPQPVSAGRLPFAEHEALDILPGLSLALAL